MAIGTAAAIGLGVTAIGGAVSASSQSKAAGKASDATVQASRENAAVQREIYGQNQQALSPFMQRGNAAGDQINALLGLGGTSQAQPAQMAPPQGGQQQNALMSGYNGGYGTVRQFQDATGYSDLNRTGSFNALGASGLPGGAPRGQAPQYFQPQSQQPAQQVDSGAAQNNAFDTFRNSTGYQFRLNEGMDALNSGYAGAGVVRSGAAMKDAVKYGQNFASNEFGNYMGYLGNQQGVGIAGASALAGVGQNFANSMSANNNNAASAIGNAALVKGQNNPFGSILGSVGGGLLGLGG